MVVHNEPKSNKNAMGSDASSQVKSPLFIKHLYNTECFIATTVITGKLCISAVVQFHCKDQQLLKFHL